jgi:osmotically-inducible protein OsmY
MANTSSAICILNLIPLYFLKLNNYCTDSLFMFKRLAMISLLASLTLSGCVPIIVAAGATAGGAVLYDNRSFKQMNEDSNLTVEARNRLNSSADLQNSAHLDVTVYNGVLLLIGQTPTPELRKQAYDLVTPIQGLKHIYNEITVQPPISSGRKLKDSWATTKVKSAMLAKNGLKSTNIRVTTENGVVFLMGDVSHKQAELATSVARRVKGVRKVVKVFDYL